MKITQQTRVTTMDWSEDGQRTEENILSHRFHLFTTPWQQQSRDDQVLNPLQLCLQVYSHTHKKKKTAMMSHLDTQRCDRDNRGLLGASGCFRRGPEPSLSFRTELNFGKKKGTGPFLPDSTEHVRSCTSWFWRWRLQVLENQNLRSLPNSNKYNHVLLY